MYLSITIILAGIMSVLILVFTKWCTHLYDIWMFIPIFIVCFIVAFIIVLIGIFVPTIFINRKKKHTKKSNYWRITMKYICQMVIQLLRIDINFRGLENVPEDKTFVLVQNHNSLVDPIVTIWTLRYIDLVFLMKKEILKFPFVGRGLERLDFPALDRENNREGLKTIVNTINMIKEGRHSVGVYPEGTRSKDGKLHEFKAGSFKIPEKCNCPLVVSVLYGTDKIKKRFPFRKTQVYIDFVACLNPSDYNGENTANLSDEVYKLMSDRLEQIQEEAK